MRLTLTPQKAIVSILLSWYQGYNHNPISIRLSQRYSNILSIKTPLNLDPIFHSKFNINLESQLHKG